METKNIFEGDLTAKTGVVYEYTEITGWLDASGADTKAAFPKLTSVGGWLDASGADTKAAFPKLTSVGGVLYASGDFHNVKQNDTEAPNKCRAALLAAFAAAGFSFADGILARVVSRRGPVSRVVLCGKTKVSYLVGDGEGNYSHGATLDEARADLMVKRTSQDLSQFKAWTLDREVSRADAIMAYRSITVACSQGTRNWLEQHETPETTTVRGIIEITKGAYGAETFKKFFAEAK